MCIHVYTLCIHTQLLPLYLYLLHAGPHTRAYILTHSYTSIVMYLHDVTQKILYANSPSLSKKSVYYLLSLVAVTGFCVTPRE